MSLFPKFSADLTSCTGNGELDSFYQEFERISEHARGLLELYPQALEDLDYLEEQIRYHHRNKNRSRDFEACVKGMRHYQRNLELLEIEHSVLAAQSPQAGVASSPAAAPVVTVTEPPISPPIVSLATSMSASSNGNGSGPAATAASTITVPIPPPVSTPSWQNIGRGILAAFVVIIKLIQVIVVFLVDLIEKIIRGAWQFWRAHRPDFWMENNTRFQRQLITAGVWIPLIILFVSSVMSWLSSGPAPNMPARSRDMSPVEVGSVHNRTLIPFRFAPEWAAQDLRMGFKRKDITPEQVDLREQLINQAQTFTALRDSAMIKGYLEGYKPFEDLVKVEVEKLLVQDYQAGQDFVHQYNTKPENLVDYFLGILAKESNFETGCDGGTGPVCPAGIGFWTGERYGLVDPVYVLDPKTGKKRYSDGVPLVERDAQGNFKTTRDERRDPKKAVPVMVRYAYDNYKDLDRRWDLAAFAYHTGPGSRKYDNGVYGLLRRAKDEGLQWQTYADLYFCDPFKYPQTFDYIQEYSTEKRNYGATYALGLQRTIELLSLARQDPDKFKELAKQQWKQDSAQEIQLCKNLAQAAMSGDKDGVKKYRAELNDPEVQKGLGGYPDSRFWSAYSCRDLNFYTYTDIRNAINRGDLVPMPNGGKYEGLNLRPANKHGIGQMATKDESVETYRHLSKEGWGLLFALADHFRLKHPEGVLDITSLVRSWQYQGRVRDTNLPTHAMGRALDISTRDLSQAERRSLVYLLNEAEYNGFIGWIPEPRSNPDHYHIVILPNERTLKILRDNYELNAD